MLLSRFWNVLLALVIGAAIFVLYLAMSMYNRAGARAMGEGLNSDSQVVAWYLRGDARQRAAQLINFAVDEKLARALHESSRSENKVPEKSRDAATASLRKINEGIPKDAAFDAVFAVDQHGRVLAHLGYEQARGMEDFELGGYPVVADALHGYVRDDTLVLDRIYRVVARPVEYELGQLPAGAIVGARIVDDRFAQELSRRTGAAIAFFTEGQRVASGAPEGFVVGQLDQLVSDLEELQEDPEFKKKGRSSVRMLAGMLGVQYTRLPGEAWQLGAGYAVARLPTHVESPFGFFTKSDDKDKQSANVWIAIGAALGVALIGLLFTVLEHTLPLRTFRREAAILASGKEDQLAPSKFRGTFRKIAADINEGLDKVAAKGGVPRKAADLNKVLGDLPDQPQMSAFAFPGGGDAAAKSSGGSPGGPPSSIGQPQSRPLPTSPGKSRPLPQAKGSVPRRPGPPGRPAPPSTASVGGSSDEQGGDDEASAWQQVYQDFVRMKEHCGESLEGFSYEKFEQTLQKNKQALVSRHGATRVKFTVYEKDGKAALKASPIRE